MEEARIPVEAPKMSLSLRAWQWLRGKTSWELAAFAILALLALGLRLWELDGRAMHYDEALHVHYGWKLANGEGYSHSPWMHGPFQVHFTALIFSIFGDSDFVARFGYALFGAALVFLPYFLRGYLGTTGALATALLLALSPSLLYFSRFGRNEILMAFWTLSLLILMWRYLNEGKNRYLYLASAVLALAFTTKETAFILALIFGAFLFILAITEIGPWLMGRLRLSDLTGPAILLVLLVTLTLPQWAALVSIPLKSAGVQLVNEGVGEVGLPVWGAPLVFFPFINLPWALDLVLLLAIPVGVAMATRSAGARAIWILPASGLLWAIYSSLAFTSGVIARDYLIAFGVLAATLIASIIIGVMWRWRVWLVCAGIFYFVWIGFYTSVFGLFVQHHGYCPAEVGSFFGTLCSRLGGVFTGSWQSLGYWLAQQEVARGGQPWYYHLVLGSTYEFLPFLVALVAIVYYLRKGEILGLLLVFWSLLALIAYTVAGEKMPWLIVNVALPFILLAGKFSGDVIEGVNWRRLLRGASSSPYGTLPTEIHITHSPWYKDLLRRLRRYGRRVSEGALWSSPITLFILTPLLTVGGLFLLLRFLDQGSLGSWQAWAILSGELLLLTGAGYLLVRGPTQESLRLAGLGLGTLVLAFSTFVGFRASYNYDDAPVEMLVYAQGSADVRTIARRLEHEIIEEGESQRVVDVDYELWYPFQWYVRNNTSVGFRCFKDNSEHGWIESCSPLKEPPSAKGLLLIASHANRDSSQLAAYEKDGPFLNILWFPESYRRPGEDRRGESALEELKEDFSHFRRNLFRREAWHNSLEYFLFRRLGSEWWNSDFYAYLPSKS